MNNFQLLCMGVYKILSKKKIFKDYILIMAIIQQRLLITIIMYQNYLKNNII